MATFAGSIFEQAWYLRRIRQLMIDRCDAPQLACYLLARTAACPRYAAERFAPAGVDIVITGDDVATQQSLMMPAHATGPAHVPDVTVG